jgi:hypothetical protein
LRLALVAGLFDDRRGPPLFDQIQIVAVAETGFERYLLRLVAALDLSNLLKMPGRAAR